MEDISEEIESWCEICEEHVIGSTEWAIHAKLESHQRNVIKFFMFDIGDMSVDEYFEKYHINKEEKDSPERRNSKRNEN